MRRIGAKRQLFGDIQGSLILLVVALTPQLSAGGILDPWQWARSDKIEVNIPWLPFENETRCYDELGCLNITRSWYHLIHRPLNVFPLPREVINTRFILYTNENPTEGHVLIVAKEKSIKRSNFDPKKKTKFIIHGFIDTPLSNWVKEMRNELLKHGDYNVIIVDWAGGSLPLYTQATANTRLVGLEIAHLVKHLHMNYGLDMSDVHLIGHSLGAHTAGYAGEKLEGKIGRITGLDPAEPYFQGMPSHLRLDWTDAQLVDVIHTDGKSIFFLGLPGYGMSQPCGHLDFYPNNGKEQPGCTDLAETTPSLPLTLIREGLEEASRVLVACNHVRAIKLFIESINSKCQYVAHECSNYASFLRGECFSCKSNNSLSCGIMGYHADSSPALVKRIAMGQDASALLGSKFFFSTGKEDPYCRNGQFQRQRFNPNVSRGNQQYQGQFQQTNQIDQGFSKQSSVNCPERNGRFPVSGQCDAYIECIDGVGEEKLCPEGLLFNPDARFNYPCGYPIDVNCEGRPKLQSAQPTDDCPHQFGYFKIGDRSNCGQFMNCADGVGYKFDCPEGLAFNAETYRCDWPDQVPDCDAEAFLGFSCPPVDNTQYYPETRFFRSPNDCQRYFVCVEGRPRLQNCGEGNAFSELINACDAAENVTGCEPPFRTEDPATGPQRVNQQYSRARFF